MMARTRLTVDVDPELRRRIRVAVASRDETIKDFLERAILRELEDLELDKEQKYYLREDPKPAAGVRGSAEVEERAGSRGDRHRGRR